MSRMTKWSVGLLMLVLPMSGCQPFTHESTIDLDSGGIFASKIDAPNRDQQVKVVADSGGVPIDVYIVLEKNREAVEKVLHTYAKPEKPLILASDKETTNASVEATIPAKEAYAVILAGANKHTTVKFKITGK